MELLVVVLIIGILSAIALPQYTKAVTKARFAEALVNLNTLVKAHKVCFLEKGESCLFDELSIDWVDDGKLEAGTWRNQKDFLYIVGRQDCNGNPGWARVHYNKEDVCICSNEREEMVLCQGEGDNGKDPTMDYAKLLNLPDVGYDGCCCF